MDITNENFFELLPEITKNIQECDFIAIDTELSGLFRERVTNRFDLPEERFVKAVENSRGYFILQFGLSCFTRLPDDELSYRNSSYNFYIFPQPNAPYGDIDRTFALQAQAIQFLSEHNFDFNKLFKHGVSYLTFHEKKLLMAQLKAGKKERTKSNCDGKNLPSFVPSQQATNCRDYLERIRKFVEDRKQVDGGDSSDVSIQTSDGHGDKLIKENTLELRECSTNQRRNLMKRILESSPLYESIEIDQRHDPAKNSTFLVVHYIDKKLKCDKLTRSLVKAKGFLEIIELIVLNKKPLVGHNLALDLIQMINQFMEPLSSNYNSFKETCHSLFPLIYDTKFIAHSILHPETLHNNQSRLNDLYCQLKTSKSSFPKIKVEHTGQAFDDNQEAHQAGYDAFMSGYSFIALCQGYLKGERDEERRHKITKMDTESQLQTSSIAQQDRIMAEFANKIYLSYSYDLKYFNLNGDDESPKRDHVFYIEFPSTWTYDDIFQVFYQYGGVIACKLNKTSALCALRESKQLGAVKKMIGALDASSIYKIVKYKTYLEQYKPKAKKKETNEGCEDVDFSDL